MRLLLRSALAVSILSVPAAALAQSAERAPAPVPVEEWSQAKVSAMGREIYVQDTAAWVATDALIPTLTAEEQSTIRGWVVLGDGATRTVRFLKADGDGVAPGWDIAVTGRTAAAPTPAAETTMTGETQARFLARQTAAENIGALRCGQYNSVVARDPDSDDWLVWLLASTTQQGVMPVGGHYRFKISADGRTMLHRDQLSNGCLNMNANPPPGPQGRPAAVVVSQIVSAGPVETHVFLSLQFGKPIYVVISRDRLYAVEGDRIHLVDTDR
ncbi:hypothetical protein [Brevundimonas sp.]|uniref:hypothetical protein n=1 Tax=Brevundimonas sp. TaxID=1871086 RepID=UPI003D0CB27D